MADLRIFSYLPNPRLFKSTITARLVGVELEIRGASPKSLAKWLWDFDARPLDEVDEDLPQFARKARAGFSGTLYKTDTFLSANPFGTVPVAFSADGTRAIFESNSMMRAVARLARKDTTIYGRDAIDAARIDGFLDVSLSFAKDTQRYLFALTAGALSNTLHRELETAFSTYMGGIELALAGPHSYIVGETITLADICFACELALFSLSRGVPIDPAIGAGKPIFDDDLAARFPATMAHFEKLLALPACSVDLTPFYTTMTLEKFMR